MSGFIDLTGKRFNRITVIKRMPRNNKHNNIQWLCRCDCGEEFISIAVNIKRATECKKCAAKHRGERSRTHGDCRTRLYRIYKAIRTRCYNPNSKSYQWYGIKGIKICPEWSGKQGYANFKEWALNNGYTDDLTIERKDIDKDYCPENCTWIPMEKQANNTRRSRMFTINGKTQDLASWAKEYGIFYQTLHGRIQRGMDIETALTTKVRKKAI